MHVVVDGHARIPLTQLVKARANAAHAAAAVRRNRKMPGDVERDAEIRPERPRQLDTHHRAKHLRRELPPARGKAIDRDAADEPLRAEIEDDAAREQERRLVQNAGDGGGSEDVLVELHPDVVERLR